jgi:hypothetical protein
VVFVFEFVYIVDYIDGFPYNKPSLSAWDGVYLVMMDDLFDVFLDSVCEDFIVWIPKWGLSQKLCHFSILHSHLRRLVSKGPWTQDGSLTCSGSQSPPGQTPLLWQGRCLDVWSPKWGLSQKLCRFCSLLAHPSQSAS